jgi:phospholipase C
MSQWVLGKDHWRRTTAIGIVLGAVMTCGLAAADDNNNNNDDNHNNKGRTQTPIKHLIVLIGENRSFDNVYATYQPKNGQTIANLLSSGIIL